MSATTTRQSLVQPDGSILRVLVYAATEYCCGLAVVEVDGDGIRRTIDVSGPRWRFGRLEEATVNWAGCGAQSPAAARSYAGALVYAAELAGTLEPSFLDARMAAEAAS